MSEPQLHHIDLQKNAVAQSREAEEERAEADRKLKEVLRGLGLEV